jgi:hypothetical protein
MEPAALLGCRIIIITTIIITAALLACINPSLLPLLYASVTSYLKGRQSQGIVKVHNFCCCCPPNNTCVYVDYVMDMYFILLHVLDLEMPYIIYASRSRWQTHHLYALRLAEEG